MSTFAAAHKFGQPQTTLNEKQCRMRLPVELWQDVLDRVNAVQAGWVVQRRQFCQFFDCPLNFGMIRTADV